MDDSIKEETRHLNQDKEIIDYFMALKTTYATQREGLEELWDQALKAYKVDEGLSRTYEGRAKVNVPVTLMKVEGIESRINRILFNRDPWGRIESKKEEPQKKNILDLLNEYIFGHQLPEIDFKSNFKEHNKNRCIYGTSIAKIPQEYEEREFSYFEDEEPELIIRKNTYFRPLLIQDFYTDASISDINKSKACIHFTKERLEDLLALEKRTVTEEIESADEQGNPIIEEKTTTVGVYENLDLIKPGDTGNMTDAQKEYASILGLSSKSEAVFQRKLKATKKSGYVEIDECYGRYDLDGDGVPEEVIVTIANGDVVIRKEPTPFRHKRYVRPFIVGRYIKLANTFYGLSKVILGLPLLYELNASRSQSTDARTYSNFPMMYEDKSKSVRWDGVWRPMGRITGVGSNGITPIINPNLSNVKMQDSVLIGQDLDQLWSLAPVQQGTSDSRLIPKTAAGTMAIIQQNDLPLNDLIAQVSNDELRPFLEMLYERNLVFKDTEDLLDIYSEEEVQKLGIDPNMSMKDLVVNVKYNILGTMELANEVAHQQGYTQFTQYAIQVPPIARRIDWRVMGEKVLKCYGISDDATDLWLDEEEVMKVQQEQAKAQTEAEAKAKEEYGQKVKTDVEGQIAEDNNKGRIEMEKLVAEASLEVAGGKNDKKAG